MLVKLSGLVTSVAGSIGGLTLQRSPDGTVGRSKPLPIRRSSTWSASARQRLKSVNEAWSTLEPSKRAGWNAFAGTVSWFNRFGDPVAGSGYKAFRKCNMASHVSASADEQRALFTEPPVSTASALPALLEFVYDLSEDKLFLTSSDAETDANTGLWLFASQPFPQGRSVNYRPMPFLTGTQPEKPLPLSLNSFYLPLHGALPDPSVRQSAFLRVQAFNMEYGWPGMSVTLPLVYK